MYLSERFLEKHIAKPAYPLDCAPPMEVQTEYEATDHKAMWNHIALVWSEYGRTDPYWSVLTDDRWRATKMTSEQILSAFYATGEDDGKRVDAWLQRNTLVSTHDAVCAEYGCGVGRVTRSLARRFRRVIAFDISEPHLDAARRRLSGEGIANVEYVLVRNEADLERLSRVDFFFSRFVLQHNPPPIMIDILDHAFRGLKSGGLAFFQIPTYSRDYSFSVAQYWAAVAAQRTMEMHFLPQQSVLELGRSHNVFPLEIQPDSSIGHRKRWISNTFLMVKPA